MTYKEFLKLVDKLDRNKYHICCEIKDMETCHWVIFRKDMSFEEYWSENNKAILDSNVNSDDELIEFVNKNKIGDNYEKSFNNNKTNSRFRERIRQLFRRRN